MMAKCPHCPLAAEDRPCLAQVARHPRYCQFMDPESPIHDERYRAMLAAYPGPPPIMDEPARPPVTESLILLERMKGCEHRTTETECGCGGLARCALGKGREGLVNHADCFACLQRPVEGSGPPAA